MRVRVLFATWSWPTHYYPSVPLLWACRVAGHEVRVATGPGLADTVTRSGLPAVVVGEDVDVAGLMRAPAAPGEQGRRGARAFVTVAEAMADDLVGFARDWRPDVVLFEPTTFAAPLAARVVGAPAARILWTVDFTRGIGELEAELLGPLARRFGVDRVGALGDLSVDPCPPELQLPGDLPTELMRYVPYNGPALLPAWLRAPADRPRVCVTWGTTLAGMGFGHGSRHAEVIEALAGLDAEVVATLVGSQRDTLGRVPGNVRVVDPVALHLLLPHCSAVIHQGGGGTMMTALSCGIPQLTVPGIPDQLLNSRQLAGTGAGRYVPAADVCRDTVAALADAVVHDGPMRAAARRLAGVMNGQPAPHAVVGKLEELAAA